MVDAPAKTNPIKPTTATPAATGVSGQKAATGTATTDKKTTDKKEADKKEADKTKDPGNKKGGAAAEDFKKPSYMGPASLKSQKLDRKAQEHAQAVEITVLNGLLAGKTFKIGQWLGVSAEEVSHESGAEWSAAGEKGVRNKLNFDKLSDRKFSLNLQFYDFTEDIAQLTENLEYLTAITGDSKRPPLLSYKQGKMVMTPVVCTSVKSTHKNPHIGQKGYRYAEVSLEFMLNAGRDTEHALGGPLAPTPITDELRSQTQQERQKEGRNSVIASTLFPCLGEKGNSQLKDILAKDALGNVDSILSLENTTFVQLAISGTIPKSVLEDAKVANKLKRDLAAVMALNESGISDMEERRFAEVLQGNSTYLSTTAQQQAEVTKPAYEQILKAVQEQKLAPNSEVFKQNNQEAGERLRALGTCGLRLRQAGAEQIKGDDPTKDRDTLDKLKSLLDKSNKGEIKDDDLKKMFGIKTESQIRMIKNRGPFVSKSDFLKRASEIQSGEGSALILWGNFENYLKQKAEDEKNKPSTDKGATTNDSTVPNPGSQVGS